MNKDPLFSTNIMSDISDPPSPLQSVYGRFEGIDPQSFGSKNNIHIMKNTIEIKYLFFTTGYIRDNTFIVRCNLMIFFFHQL